MKRTDKLLYVGLLAVIMLATYIRLTPVLDVGTGWLADLDPYRNLRAVNEIINSNRMPIFDPLSAAPNGTYATYSTSQGYYMLSAVLTLISGLSSVEVLSVSPVIYEIALLLAVYVFGSALTKCRGAGLFATFFTATPRGWAMIAIIGTCPLAENVGAVIFPLVLLLFWKYINNKRMSFLICSSLLLGVSLLIHPITYFYLCITIFTYAVLLCLVEKKIKALTMCFKVLSLSLFAVLIQFHLVKDFGSISGFTHGALWLASLQPVYPVIDFYVVLNEVGGVTLFLGLLMIMLFLFDRRWNYLVLVSWSITMFTVIALSSVTGLRAFLASFPFGAFIILSHRVMPYLPLALSLLSGIVAIEYLLPLTKDLIRTLNLCSISKSMKAEFALAIVFFLFSVPLINSSRAYASNYAGFSEWGQHYDPLFEWIKSNTKTSDVFIANEISLGEVIRTVANRPAVFTLSYQDLATPDLERRMWLQSSVFIREYDDRIAQRLLHDYNVSYVIVVKEQYNIDILNKKYVFPTGNSFLSYIEWMDNKAYLSKVYSDEDETSFVFSVIRHRLYQGEIKLPMVKI